MLMVFDREPGQNQDLPGEIAQRSRSKTTQNGPSSSLELRSRDMLREDVDQLAELPPITTAPASSTGDLAASPVETRLEAQVRQEAAPSSGAGGLGGAMAGNAALRSEEESIGEDLLVVHVNMKPEALQNRAFNKVAHQESNRGRRASRRRSETGCVAGHRGGTGRGCAGSNLRLPDRFGRRSKQLPGRCH